MATLISFTQLSKIWKIAAGGGLVLLASGGIVATLITKNSSGAVTRTEYSDGRSTQSGTLTVKSGALAVNLRPNGDGSFQGTLTGNHLYTGTMSGAGLADCDSENQTLNWDATTGRFSCLGDGGGSGFNSGQVINLTENKYVQRDGDSMTGALSIAITGGNNATLGLKVINQASGSYLHAEKSLSTSGTLVWEGAASGSSLYAATSINGAGLATCNGGQALQWASGRFGCFTPAGSTYIAGQGLTLTSGAFKINSSITGSLVNFLTVSGGLVKAYNTLASSGTLVFEGAASGSSLFLGTSLEGAGLTSCSNGTTSKLLWNSTTKRFSCGADTDTDTNTTYTAGRGLTLTSTAFSTNDTQTGTMLRFLTVSGALVRAKNTLASSGALTWEGAGSGASLYVADDFEGAGLVDCDTAGTSKLLWDSTAKRFSCGTDTDTDTNTTYTAGQGLTLTSTSFSVNSTLTGTLARFLTVSGSVLTAKSSLVSSGSLKVLGAMSGKSLTVSSLRNCDTIDTDANGALACGTDANSGGGANWSNTGSLQNRFDGRYVNTFGDTMTGALNIIVSGGDETTVSLETPHIISGAIVNAGNILTAGEYATNNRGLAIKNRSGSIVAKLNDNIGFSGGPGGELRLFDDHGTENVTLTAAYNQTFFALYTPVTQDDGITMGVNDTEGPFVFVKLSAAQSSIPLTVEDTSGNDIITIGTNGALTLNESSQDVDTRFESDNNASMFFLDASADRIGLGTNAPDTTLEVAGAVSGSTLTVSSLKNCDTIDTNAAGVLSCGTDASGAGGSNWSNTGSLQNRFDGRYVNTSGDTMTGALTIDITGGDNSTLGLNVLNTTSGSIIKAAKTLASSGSLTWEGAASGATLYVGTSINGAGLVDCDLATQTVAWDSTAGRFSCGTDSDTTYTAGQGLTLTATSFKTNSTLTGALASFTTVSGALVKAVNTLASSGTLVVEGAMSGASLFVGTSIRGAGLVADCDTAGTSKVLWDTTLGKFSCGTDTDTNTTYTAGQGLTLTSTSFRLSPSHSGTTIWAVNTLASSGSLSVDGTMSGYSLFVSRNASVSGALAIEGAAVIGGNLTAGDLICATAGCIGATELGTDSVASDEIAADQVGQSEVANNALDFAELQAALDVDEATTITLSSNGLVFDASSTGQLEVVGTFSGRTLYAQQSLRSSGSLVWEGTATGTTLNVTAATSFMWIPNCAFLKTGAAGALACGTVLPVTAGGTAQTDFVYKDLILSAGGGTPQTTSGSVAKAVNFSTNGVMLQTQDFSGSGNIRYTQWSVIMPKSYDGGTMTGTVMWTANTANGRVRWMLQCLAIGSGGTIDSSWGTPRGMTGYIVTGASNKLQTSSPTGAITCAGTPKGEGEILFRLARDPSVGQDTLAGTGRFINAILRYKTNSFSD